MEAGTKRYEERPCQQLMMGNKSTKTFEYLRVTLNKTTINDNENRIAPASLITLLMMRNVCKFSEFVALELSYLENHVYDTQLQAYGIQCAPPNLWQALDVNEREAVRILFEKLQSSI